jgi:hypothetical protein
MRTTGASFHFETKRYSHAGTFTLPQDDELVFEAASYSNLEILGMCLSISAAKKNRTPLRALLRKSKLKPEAKEYCSLVTFFAGYLKTLSPAISGHARWQSPTSPCTLKLDSLSVWYNI